ncbi:MAG TPA: glycosyltransferase family 4 protein [Gemmatimonadales bacterium]|nr:glycosyltransferase family 4 protein [Gemmatimonadales bacterium]
MRIAQVSPLFESVPPKLYGGTERVVSYLTEELVAAGHDVTLFASGDSVTSARLIPVTEQSLRLDETCRDQIAHHIRLVDEVYRHRQEFDFIHFHIDYFHFPVSARVGVPRATTLHGQLDLPELVPLYRNFPDEPVISISDAQRTALPWIHWIATVYHGLPADLLRLHERPGSYLAFLGRFSPEKGPDRAVEIARRSGIPLLMAAKVDKVDQDYYDSAIKPLLDPAFVQYVGEVNEHEKEQLLGDAIALLFPIDWPEPFGLVLIEAMACGTPVIAFRRGSVPEIIEDGVSGCIVDDLEGAVAAVPRAAALDRRRCRDAFEARFTSAHMAASYLEVYRRAIAAPAKGPVLRGGNLSTGAVLQ